MVSPSTDTGSKESPQLNQAFLTAGQSMGSMQEIVNGKFLDEAFENLSTDEKLSMILTEIYKLRDNISSIQRSHNTLQQKVDTHQQELEIGQGSQVLGETLEQIEQKTKKNEEDIIDLHNDKHGMETRLATVEANINTNLAHINLLKGTVQRQHKQIATNQGKVVDLTARSMDHNFTISGLKEDKQENCILESLQFLRSKMGLTVDQNEIIVAHRLGKFNPANRKPRLMVIKVMHSLKEKILPNMSRLKDKTNEQGVPYFINIQLPEALATERRAIQYEIKQVKDYNEALPAGYKKKQFVVKNRRLFIDDQPHQQEIQPPNPADVFVSANEQKKMDQIDFSISKPKSQEQSQFIGLATKVYSQAEVDRAYKKVRQMYPCYDHIIMAYTIMLPAATGYQDDGEHSAGMKIHSLMNTKRAQNTAVFVARNFGGVHLGPARFDCINLVAGQALDALLLEHPNIPLPANSNSNDDWYRHPPNPPSPGVRIPINSRLRDIANSQVQEAVPSTSDTEHTL